MAAIICARFSGSAHRAFEALPIFARLVGSRSAVLIFSLTSGSAHRALAARLWLDILGNEASVTDQFNRPSGEYLIIAENGCLSTFNISRLDFCGSPHEFIW